MNYVNSVFSNIRDNSYQIRHPSGQGYNGRGGSSSSSDDDDGPPTYDTTCNSHIFTRGTSGLSFSLNVTIMVLQLHCAELKAKKKM